MQTIAIPASVTEIDDSAFENCRSISSISFGQESGQKSTRSTASSLKRIGNWAFYNCHQLLELAIPEGVTEIGNAAFYGCTYLENLELPASVQAIPVSIYDMQGRMVYSGTAATVSQPAGVYVLRCAGASSKVLF